MKSFDKQTLKKRIYQHINDNMPSLMAFTDEQAEYLIKLINDDDYIEEVCQACLHGKHKECWDQRAKFRSPDSIVIKCTCNNHPDCFRILKVMKMEDVGDDHDLISREESAKIMKKAINRKLECNHVIDDALNTSLVRSKGTVNTKVFIKCKFCDLSYEREGVPE